MPFGSVDVGDKVRFEYMNGPTSLNPGDYSIREGVVTQIDRTVVRVQAAADNYPKSYRYDRIGEVEIG